MGGALLLFPNPHLMNEDTKQALQVTLGFILFLTAFILASQFDYQIALLEAR
tara:strand:- start:27463 stop:27618 length:156 start_codon:yes stop_codon:yes gene_type:complete